MSPKKKAAPKPRKQAKKAAPVSKPENRPLPSFSEKHADSPKKRRGKTSVQLFISEYLVDLNGRQAAIRSGYSELSARQIAVELLAKPEVKEAVAAAMKERSERTAITVDKVLERLWAVAHADPNELIEHRRICCRYCYGKNHRYQRTPREMQAALEQFERDRLAAAAKNQEYPYQFDEQGGIGFDPRKDPTSACPECFGEGEEKTFPKDTRDLSPEAKLLYAGVKTTKEGLEIKMHSQSEALVNIGKHLGMFQQKVQHSNDPENPMPVPGYVIIPAKSTDGSTG